MPTSIPAYQRQDAHWMRQALLEAKKQGLTREIGISNFTIPLMEKAIAAAGSWTRTRWPTPRCSASGRPAKPCTAGG